MAPEKSPSWKTIPISEEAYGILIDFCIGFLGLEDVPDEEALGSVAAYLLGAGMQAVEDKTASERATQDVAS